MLTTGSPRERYMPHSTLFVVFLILIGIHSVQAQTAPKLALDPTKPIVYVKFDHSGPRDPVQDGEPKRGLWLRLVNNSVIPITVRANGSSTDENMVLLPDTLVGRFAKIPISGVTYGKKPYGYDFEVASPDNYRSGEGPHFQRPGKSCVA